MRPHERTHAHARQGGSTCCAPPAPTRRRSLLYDDPDGRPRAALAPAADRSPDMQATDGDDTQHRFWRVEGGGGRGRAGGAGRPRDPDRRRPSPLRDGAGLPGRAARARRRPGRRPALRLRADVPRQPAWRGAGRLSHPPRCDGAARGRPALPGRLRRARAAGRHVARPGRVAAGRDRSGHGRLRALARQRPSGADRPGEGHEHGDDGDAGAPRRCAPSTPPCSRRWCWRRCWA